MKKLPFRLMVIFPYLYSAVMAVFFILSRLFSALDRDAVLFSLIGVFLFLPLLFCALHLLAVLTEKAPSCLVWARMNLFMKLSGLPAVLAAAAVLAASILSVRHSADAGAMGGGLAVVAWGLLLLPVFWYSLLQWIVGAVVCARLDEMARKNGNPRGIGWYHVLLHLLPVGDILSARQVYRKFQMENMPLRY